MKNSVCLIGRVGSDPEMRTTGNGTKVCNLSLATSEKWTNDKGEKQESTQWHKLTIWDKAAEVAEKYVKKGDVFCVDGKIHYRDYTDKDGQKKYVTEIVVDEMTLLPNKKD